MTTEWLVTNWLSTTKIIIDRNRAWHYPTISRRMITKEHIAERILWEKGEIIKGYDYLSNIIHELGHVIGMEHSVNRDSVMYRKIAYNEQKRYLLESDMRELLCIYREEFFE